MNELFLRIFTNMRWFLGFLIVLAFLILFFWRLISPESYASAINGFMHDMWELAKFFITLIIMGMGIALVIGWRPFGKKGKH